MMLDRLTQKALAGLAASLLLALIAVTCLDVVGRYFLNAPLHGAFELTELLLGALVFAALPLVSRSGGHVEVDLLTTLLPIRINRLLAVFAAAVSALVLCYFAWQLLELGLRQWHDGSRSVSLEVAYAPFAFFGMITCLLSAWCGVLREIRRD